MIVKDTSSPDLRERRRRLLADLPPMTRVLRGSLIERYKRCGRPGCHCAEGTGHGPKRYLSVSATGKRPQMDYVPNTAVDEVSEYLSNFNHVREVLNEICAINVELLRRREALD